MSVHVACKTELYKSFFTGEMSFCPGYLSITINDLQDAEELFRYDALIFCPATFNMSFKVPNRGQKPDRTFEIRLEDAKKSYRYVSNDLVKRLG